MKLFKFIYCMIFGHKKMNPFNDMWNLSEDQYPARDRQKWDLMSQYWGDKTSMQVNCCKRCGVVYWEER